MYFAFTTVFTVYYWNERDAEWRGTGAGTIFDLPQAKQRLRALAEQCDYCVRFKVDQVGLYR